jgi:tetratricopeptide (TPR) repeat protein
MREEHGAEPAPETAALVRRIRARTAAGDAAPLPIGGIAAPRSSAPTTAVDPKATFAERTISDSRARSLHRAGRVLLATALTAAGIAGGTFARNGSAPRSTSRAVIQSRSGPQERATRAPAPKRGTLDPVALDLYVRGRHWWQKRGPGLLTSIDFFTKALDADPTFALAYSGLGDAYVQLGYASLLRPDDAFPKARAAAQRALELDSTLAEPHATLGYVKLYFEWNWPDAEREFRRALALDPSYATGHEWYGLYLAAMGRFDEAIAEERRAQELDPLSTATAATSAWVQYYADRLDAAERELQVVLREDPTFALGHFYLGRVHEAKGNAAQALAEYDATGPLRTWVPTVAARGRLLANEGRVREAHVSLATMDSMARRTYVTAYAVALVHAALAQPDSAFAWLERGVEERTHWLVWLNRDPRWQPIRGDARFAALVRRVGLPP